MPVVYSSEPVSRPWKLKDLKRVVAAIPADLDECEVTYVDVFPSEDNAVMVYKDAQEAIVIESVASQALARLSTTGKDS